MPHVEVHRVISAQRMKLLLRAALAVRPVVQAMATPNPNRNPQPVVRLVEQEKSNTSCFLPDGLI